MHPQGELLLLLDGLGADPQKGMCRYRAVSDIDDLATGLLICDVSEWMFPWRRLVLVVGYEWKPGAGGRRLTSRSPGVTYRAACGSVLLTTHGPEELADPLCVV